jgi:hypothetical protein
MDRRDARTFADGVADRRERRGRRDRDSTEVRVSSGLRARPGFRARGAAVKRARGRGQIGRAAWPVLALGLVALASARTRAADDGTPAVFKSLKTPAPVVKLRPATLEKPSEVSCAACHAAVVAEWADSAHALAWADEIYIEQLKDKRKPDSCYGCHIPKPLMQGELGKKPAARDGDRRFGVTCESCHQAADGAMLGPREVSTSAHASKKSDVFVGAGSNALCIGCHRVNIGPVVGVAKDFEQAHLAEQGKSCVGCHTAPVEQAFANAPAGASNGDAAEPPKRQGRSHALQTPRDPTFLARAFEATARVAGSKTIVTLKNAAGHRVPGLIGKKIELSAEALDAQGAVVARAKLELDAETPLPVGESADITLAAAAASVHLTGVEHDPRGDGPVKFLDSSVAVAPR